MNGNELWRVTQGRCADTAFNPDTVMLTFTVSFQSIKKPYWFQVNWLQQAHANSGYWCDAIEFWHLWLGWWGQRRGGRSGGRMEEEEEEKQQPLHHSSSSRSGSGSIVLDKCAEIGSWDLHELRCVEDSVPPSPASGPLRGISHGPTEAERFPDKLMT